MAEKQVKTRIQHKRGTSSDWSQAKNFRPLDGELIIYKSDDASGSPQLKVGNGSDLPVDLPFVTCNDKMDKINPTGSGSLSLNRKDGNDVECATVVGKANSAIDSVAFASGEETTAGYRSHTEGYLTYAENHSHAEGRLAQATGKGSHAEGVPVSTGNKEYPLENGNTIDSCTLYVTGDPFHEIHVGDFIIIKPRVEGSFQATDAKKVVSVHPPVSDETETIIEISTPFRAANYNEENGAPANGIFPGDSIVTKTTPTIASGYGSHAEGHATTASGTGSHAEGYKTEASGTRSHAEGEEAVASGYSAHAEGRSTQATESSTHAEGLKSQATNTAAHAEGYNTQAQGSASHAEGSNTTASGVSSHAEGNATNAQGDYSHAEGHFTEASGHGSHAEGSNVDSNGGILADYVTKTDGKTITSSTASGHGSHAEGVQTYASGYSAHAEGLKTEATGGQGAHAEGSRSQATNTAAHAEGYNTQASGTAAHAEGNATVAQGNYTHAEGLGTIAASTTQHVQGKYNIADKDGTYAHIVGGGSSSNRKNIHTLDWEGNANFAGKVYSNGKELSSREIFIAIHGRTTWDEMFEAIRYNGYKFIVCLAKDENGADLYLPLQLDGEPVDDFAFYFSSYPYRTYHNQIKWSEIEVIPTLTENDIASKLDSENPTGSGSLSINRKDTNDFKYVTVTGTNNSAIDNVAFASGDSTEAGWRSHTEGYMTYADNTSHAEGRLAKALGKGSHAEGVEAYEDVKVTINGTEILSTTTAPIHIDDTQFTVVGDVTNTLSTGHTISIGPTDTVAGFATTDSRKIVAMEIDNTPIEIKEVVIDSYRVNYLTDTYFTISNNDDVASKLSIGDSVKIYYTYLGNNSETEAITETVIIDNKISTDESVWDFEFVPKLSHYTDGADQDITKKIIYTSNLNTKITINSPFRNEFNYYKGHNVPDDGYIPTGAKLRQTIPTMTGSDAEGAHAEGKATQALGRQSHTEGKFTVAFGENSHAEGNNTTASGISSHAEGDGTTASNYYSHAEGKDTVASGSRAHAEGEATEASGKAAHSEGINSKALGEGTHAEGIGTIATRQGQHVQGRYNVRDTANEFAHIVGWGSSDTSRKNIHTIDTKGNARFDGDVYTGPFATRKKLATENFVTTKLTDYAKISSLNNYATKEYVDSKEVTLPFETVDDVIKLPKLILTDTVTGADYFIEMRDGTLVSYLANSTTAYAPFDGNVASQEDIEGPCTKCYLDTGYDDNGVCSDCRQPAWESEYRYCTCGGRLDGNCVCEWCGTVLHSDAVNGGLCCDFCGKEILCKDCVERLEWPNYATHGTCPNCNNNFGDTSWEEGEMCGVCWIGHYDANGRCSECGTSAPLGKRICTCGGNVLSDCVCISCGKTYHFSEGPSCNFCGTSLCQECGAWLDANGNCHCSSNTCEFCGAALDENGDCPNYSPETHEYMICEACGAQVLLEFSSGNLCLACAYNDGQDGIECPLCGGSTGSVLDENDRCRRCGYSATGQNRICTCGGEIDSNCICEACGKVWHSSDGPSCGCCEVLLVCDNCGDFLDFEDYTGNSSCSTCRCPICGTLRELNEDTWNYTYCPTCGRDT